MTDLDKLIESATKGAIDDVRDIVERHPELVGRRDNSGATALHYAAFSGHRNVVELLVEKGADINARDFRYKATPAGWAIEYLREMGGFLGIELTDFGHAIRTADVEWTMRFLNRFPKLRDAADDDGMPFQTLAVRTGNTQIIRMFE